jgi:hypothetical protein
MRHLMGREDMKAISITLLAAALAGCATQPVTRNEFVSHTASGAMGSKVVDTSVSRSYEQVVSDLRRKFDECMNYSRVGTEQTQGYYKQTTSYYWATVKAVGTDKTEITFRTNTESGKPSNPDGGWIRAAADIHRLGRGKTRVVAYGTYLFGQGIIPETVKDWAEGKSAECPRVR